MSFGGEIRPEGALHLEKIRGRGSGPPPAGTVRKAPLRWRLRNLRHLWRGWWRWQLARLTRRPFSLGRLYAQVLHADGSITDYGLVSLRVVTDAGVQFIVDAFQNTVELEDMKFHGYGTGTTAEAASGAGASLVTELTTEYAVDNTRPTGTTTEGASANIYRTVATLSPDSGGTIAVTEHAVLDQASNAGGVVLDRSVFAAINVDSAAGDSLQSTYELTLPSGS